MKYVSVFPGKDGQYGAAEAGEDSEGNRNKKIIEKARELARQRRTEAVTRGEEDRVNHAMEVEYGRATDSKNSIPKSSNNSEGIDRTKKNGKQGNSTNDIEVDMNSDEQIGKSPSVSVDKRKDKFKHQQSSSTISHQKHANTSLVDEEVVLNKKRKHSEEVLDTVENVGKKTKKMKEKHQTDLIGGKSSKLKLKEDSEKKDSHRLIVEEDPFFLEGVGDTEADTNPAKPAQDDSIQNYLKELKLKKMKERAFNPKKYGNATRPRKIMTKQAK